MVHGLLGWKDIMTGCKFCWTSTCLSSLVGIHLGDTRKISGALIECYPKNPKDSQRSETMEDGLS